jgi:putative phage-type endonuclease
MDRSAGDRKDAAMPITDIQREERKTRLGASDVASVLGLNPYKSQYKLWAEKTGKPVADEQESLEMELGNIYEPHLIKWSEQAIGRGEVVPNVEVPHGELPMVALLDGEVKAYHEPDDAKTSGWRNANTHYRMYSGVFIGFGEDGSDEVPDSVGAQLYAQIACCRDYYKTDVQQGWVPAFVAGRGRFLYRVGFNVDVWADMAESLHHFWYNHVVRDIPPEEAEPEWNIVRQLQVRKAVGAVVAVPDMQRFLQAQEHVAELKAAQTELETAKAVLVQAGQSAEYLVCPEARAFVHVSQTEVKPKTFRELALKKGSGLDWDAVAKEGYTTTRVTRLKNGLPKRLKLTGVGLNQLRLGSGIDTEKGGES